VVPQRHGLAGHGHGERQRGLEGAVRQEAALARDAQRELHDLDLLEQLLEVRQLGASRAMLVRRTSTPIQMTRRPAAGRASGFASRGMFTAATVTTLPSSATAR
jgi:hypothetical protein